MKIATRLVYEEALKLIADGKVDEMAESAAGGALTFLVLAAASGIVLALIAWRNRNTKGRKLGELACFISACAVAFSLFMSFTLFLAYSSFSNNQLSCAVGIVIGDIEDNIDDPDYMYELGTG